MFLSDAWFYDLFGVCVLWLFLHFVHVSYQLPQQENSFDCGLFLLHYLELFLVEAPVNFSPFRINEFNKFVSSPHQMFLWKILHFYFSKAKGLNMVESCILNSARWEWILAIHGSYIAPNPWTMLIINPFFC